MIFKVRFSGIGGVDLNGCTLTMHLWRPNLVNLFLSPKATHTVINNEAEFHIDEFNIDTNIDLTKIHYIFRLDKGSKTYWRSGVITWDEWDEWTGIEGFLRVEVIPFDELSNLPLVGNEMLSDYSEGLVFNTEQLREMLPETPIKQDNLTLTSIELKAITGRIIITGRGYYTYFGVNWDFTYEYSFTFSPERSNFSSGHNSDLRLLRITDEILDVQVNNIVINFIKNLIFKLFKSIKNNMLKNITNQLQSEINQIVSHVYATTDTPEGTTITAYETYIYSGSGLEISAFVGVPWTPSLYASIFRMFEELGNICPLNNYARQLKSKDKAIINKQFEHVRAIRDGLLKNNKRGLAYLEMMKANAPEISIILMYNNSLYPLIKEIINDICRLFPKESPREGRLSPLVAQKLFRIADSFEKLSSEKLASTIEYLKNDIKDFVDQPAGEVLEKSDWDSNIGRWRCQ